VLLGFAIKLIELEEVVDGGSVKALRKRIEPGTGGEDVPGSRGMAREERAHLRYHQHGLGPRSV